MLTRRLLLVAIGLLAGFCLPFSVRADDASVQTVWRLLDYMAVDYRGAVGDGGVVNQSEYAEMVEFAASVRERLSALPPVDMQKQLTQQAERLQAAVSTKAAPAEVTGIAHSLASALLAAYPIPQAPPRAPDLAKVAVLYGEQCAACHGATGHGDGSAAATLAPPPIAFTDRARARERSIFALYQVIDLGIDGTPMPSFAALPSDERWGLAFYVGQFAYSENAARAGERLWKEDASLRHQFPNLVSLTRLTPAALAERVGEDKAQAITAFLRCYPTVISPGEGSTLALARAQLAASVKAYEAGDRDGAADLALSAYLDGFEPTEAVLAGRNADLVARVERAMGELRAQIGRNATAASVRTQIQTLDKLFREAELALAPDQASDASSFAAAFTVLLREGLEALLVVVAIIALLRKVERPDVLAFVHGGWIVALAAGALTWVAATYFITVSGASRELTEGFGSLFAAVVLLFVGIWMHGKSQADAWQQYVSKKLSRALSRRSAWFLFLLSFVVVYREVFETILFYTALWSQGNRAAIGAGAGMAGVALGAIAWIMLRYSRRLPIVQFFSFSSVLVAVLAVVLAGKGVAALQESGVIDVRPLAGFPRIAVLGVYPTLQAIAGQVLTLAIVIAGFWYNRRVAIVIPPDTASRHNAP